MVGKITLLEDRAVLALTGPDATNFLQGLITNDIALLERASAIHAGLLSPQGKILFEFFVVRAPDGLLLDVARDRSADVTKRLSMYKLRADVAISDASDRHRVFAAWGGAQPNPAEAAIVFADPRSDAMGWRILASDLPTSATDADYSHHRVALGVPEGGKDYAFGDAVPHDADFDLFHGVSFTKGCYVGQEVVARMQNKSIVRKRVVRVHSNRPLEPAADILIGEAPVGRVGTVAGNMALAMLRLDRAVEAEEQGTALTSAGIVVTPDEQALARYRTSVASRPAAPSLS